MSYDIFIWRLKSFEGRRFPLSLDEIKLPDDLDSFDEEDLELFMKDYSKRFEVSTWPRCFEYHYAGPYTFSVYYSEDGLHLSRSGLDFALSFAQKLSSRCERLIIVDPQKGKAFDLPSWRAEVEKDPSQTKAAIRANLETGISRMLDNPRLDEGSRRSAEEALKDLRENPDAG